MGSAARPWVTSLITLALAAGCARNGGFETAYDEASIIEVTVLEAVPTAYAGRWVTGVAEVAEVAGEGVFWAGTGAQRLMVVVDPRAGGVPAIVPGEALRLTGLLLPGRASRETGAWLDPAILDTLRAQDRFLLVPAREVRASTTAPAEATGRASLSAWDADQDGFVSREELTSGIVGDLRVRSWDMDRDLHLDPAELGAAMFDAFDEDDGALVSQTEWERSVGAWFGDRVDPGTFDGWDTDDDGSLDLVEVTGAERAVELFEAWDLDDDQRLAHGEIAAGVLATWDADDDRLLGREEYEPFAEQWLRGDRDAFSTWDLDRDDAISRSEVGEAWRRFGLFDVWDVDDDDLVGTADIESTLFDAWDVDADHRIERDEFRDGFDAWFPAADAGFLDWDLDADGGVDREEFATAIGGRGVWDAWDLDDDGFFSSVELEEGVFGFWDTDGDGLWDGGEFAVYF